MIDFPGKLFGSLQKCVRTLEEIPGSEYIVEISSSCCMAAAYHPSDSTNMALKFKVVVDWLVSILPVLFQLCSFSCGARLPSILIVGCVFEEYATKDCVFVCVPSVMIPLFSRPQARLATILGAHNGLSVSKQQQVQYDYMCVHQKNLPKKRGDYIHQCCPQASIKAKRNQSKNGYRFQIWRRYKSARPFHQ